MQSQSPIKTANRLFREKNYTGAVSLYLQAMGEIPELAHTFAPGALLARSRYRRERQDRKLDVAVCGWELSHNAAGRVHTLARLYETFADVKIIGSHFPNWGRELWPPLRDSNLPIHSFVAEDQSRFIAQAIELTAAHPCDVLHLSGPRLPNILFGLLYKLVWEAVVLMDINEEQPASADEDAPLGLAEHLHRHGGLPQFKAIAGPDWTRIAVGLAGAFDGVTVANVPLQERHGGEIIRHARDERCLVPSPELRTRAREAFGLDPDSKVVLFFGTPRPHQGLVETAQALAALERRDVVFAVIGDFQHPELKRQLESVEGVNLFFAPDQSIESIPEVTALGDVCVLLQADGVAARFRTPAKLSDALAMELAVVVQGGPALADVCAGEAVVAVTSETLSSTLAELLDRPDRTRALGIAARDLFLDEFSFAANVPRLQKAVEAARTAPASLISLLPLLWTLDALKPYRFLGKNAGEQNRAMEIVSKRVNRPSTGATGPRCLFSAVSQLDVLLNPRVRQTTYARKLKEFTVKGLAAEPAEVIGQNERELSAFLDRLHSASDLPLVSVVMPTWNRAGIVGDSISTVVEQFYPHWELFVCDDASTDHTEDVVKGFKDSRIHYLKLPKVGAAAARNAGLKKARGHFIAYLDSDNYWHPGFLAIMVFTLMDHAGRSCAYADFLDFHVSREGEISLLSLYRPPFHHENLLKKPFIDLNSFVHRRELYDCFGGFNEMLPRRQDYDLILKYTWLRDPLHVQKALTLYHRNDNLDQITQTQKDDRRCVSVINRSLEDYFHRGLPLVAKPDVRKVTLLSWDLCRNHFSKPFALAEALSEHYRVQLISFRFFDEEIFPPLQGVQPSFETLYLPGKPFPEFFDSMARALEAVDGDVIYAVKPRLPSLGLALLANHRRGIPIILEINDLETVVGSPRKHDRHEEVDFARVNLDDKALLNPYADIWSRILDPISRELPVLMTHNREIDAHYGHRCLYMRNIKDESVYDPGRYDRNRIREELGFKAGDRVILFGGLLRKHKGIFELVELIQRLNDPRYKLLFVGSRPNPDQEELIEKHGSSVTVLPPRDRSAMARINFAADLVIIWLDPEVSAAHYQMPYKVTDALAMHTPVIANDISDLGDLGRQGYLRIVPFGDWDGMLETIKNIFADEAQRKNLCLSSRRLYLRQFSYAAARSCFAPAAKRALLESAGPLPVAAAFAGHFDAFHGAVTKKSGGLTARSVSQRSAPPGGTDLEAESIRVLDVARLDDFHLSDPAGAAVVMPSIDMTKARETARILLKRAGMSTTILVAEDTARRGFIRTLNDVCARLHVRYIVYLAEDAFPGLDWLKLAYDRLEETGKGLLGFNDGKWRGRIAAFGMVRVSWVKELYGGPIFFPGYDSHKADNELTAIARCRDEYVYDPRAGLFELDRNKVFTDRSKKDPELFKDRFKKGFHGLVPLDRALSLAPEYRVPIEGRLPHTTDRNLFPETSDGFEAPIVELETLADLKNASANTQIIALVPLRDRTKARRQADRMARRAGIDCKILLYPPNLLEAAQVSLLDLPEFVKSTYVAIVELDHHPGLNWLRLASMFLKDNDKNFVRFNDGRNGMDCACCMFHTSLSASILDDGSGPVRSNLVDEMRNLAFLAMLSDTCGYEPDAVLLDHTDREPGDMLPSHAAAAVASTVRSGFPYLNLDTGKLDGNLDHLRKEGTPKQQRILQSLERDAQEALQRGPFSVIDKLSMPPGGDRRDYWHPAPYWWPNPNTHDGLPFVNRDGRRVSGTRLYEPESEKYDRSRLQRVFDDSFVLSMAWKATGRTGYLQHARTIFHRFFIDPQTRMNPHLKYAQVRMGHDNNMGTKSGIIEMKDLYYYLDSVGIMIDSGILSRWEIAAFKGWLKMYLGWLLQSSQGKEEALTMNNHGTYYDLQTASLAAFLGIDALVRSILDRARSRLDVHFKPDGSQPNELKRNTSAHYCCFNFQSWINLARLAENWGLDLWAYEAPGGANLRQGARRLLEHMGGPWPYEQIDAFDTDRFLPIWFVARRHVDGLPPLPEGIESPLDVKPVFFPHDGIRPYWNLDVSALN